MVLILIPQVWRSRVILNANQLCGVQFAQKCKGLDVEEQRIEEQKCERLDREREYVYSFVIA